MTLKISKHIWQCYRLVLFKVESTAAEGQCLGTNGDRFSKQNQPLDLVNCQYRQPNHVYILTKRHEIRSRLRCLDGESPEKQPIFKLCQNKQGSQKFAYINEVNLYTTMHMHVDISLCFVFLFEWKRTQWTNLLWMEISFNLSQYVTCKCMCLCKM